MFIALHFPPGTLHRLSVLPVLEMNVSYAIGSVRRNLTKEDVPVQKNAVVVQVINADCFQITLCKNTFILIVISTLMIM